MAFKIGQGSGGGGGGGAVASVNGKTGVVALVASDVGAAPTAAPTFTGIVTFADAVVHKTSGGQGIFATSSGVLYLYTGTNGLRVVTSGAVVAIGVTDAGGVTMAGTLGVGGAITSGGQAVALAPTRTAFGDASAAVPAGTRTIALSTAFTAARTLTLPAASGQPVGQPLYLVDEIGAISSANTLTLAAAGSDTLNGAASVTYATGRPVLELFSDGVTKWSIGVRPIAGGGTGATTAAAALANLTSAGAVLASAGGQLNAINGAALTGVGVTVYPNTAAGKGLVVRMLASQTGRPFQVQDSSGATVIEVNSGGDYYGRSYQTLIGYVALGDSVLGGSPGLGIGSSAQIAWCSAAGYTYGGARDVGLARSAAGVLKVTNGSTGGGGLQVGAFATASRPSASTSGVGTQIYDTTLSKPIWSDGTTWRDATGTAV